ncbi:RHS repeat protein, partial [Macrococcus equipercicus]
NSKTNHTGMFGLGWMSGFERRLNIEDTAVTPKVVQYTEEDGSNHLFINQDGKLLAPTGVDYEFNILNGEYIIQDEDGTQEVYGKDGLLNRIEYDAKQTGKKNAVRFIYADADGIKQLKSILSASDSGDGAASKNRIEFDYNDQNLVTKMTVSGSSDSNAASRIYTYQYDSFKRLTSVTGPDGTYTYSYREKYVLNADGTEVSPEDVRYPGEIEIYGMPGNKWLFRHDELGRVNQTKLPMNTGSIDYEFGENGAIESIMSEMGTANVVNDQYSYDQYGNMSQKQSNGVVSVYQYDAMDQLTEEKIGGKIFSYVYDKRGNRTSVNGVNATFNIMNQLTQFGSESISYDADGNRTGDGKFTYEWNALGQMTRLTEKSTGETWTYQYDEQGRRITKMHNGTTTHYHYDKDTNHLMAESQDGQVIRQYIRDQKGELLGLKVNDKYYSYHKNYRGDVIGITDMSGNLQASYEYDSWGNVLKEDIKDSNLKNQPFKYASYYYDTESSQYYLMARYYNPKQGAFLSVDPEIDGDESVAMNNGYAYANNNPVKNIDADGKWFWAAAGGAWGAYDGHRWAKSRGYTGWKYYGSVAAGAAWGASGGKWIGKAAGWGYRGVKAVIKSSSRYNHAKRYYQIGKSQIQFSQGTRRFGYRRSNWAGSYRLDREPRNWNGYSKGNVWHVHRAARTKRQKMNQVNKIHYPLHPYRYRAKGSSRHRWTWRTYGRG